MPLPQVLGSIALFVLVISLAKRGDRWDHAAGAGLGLLSLIGLESSGSSWTQLAVVSALAAGAGVAFLTLRRVLPEPSKNPDDYRS